MQLRNGFAHFSADASAGANLYGTVAGEYLARRATRQAAWMLRLRRRAKLLRAGRLDQLHFIYLADGWFPDIVRPVGGDSPHKGRLEARKRAFPNCLEGRHE
jgi:hypothetical protein